MIAHGAGKIFRREPGRFEAIDGIRALSVIWVIFFHTALVWGDAVAPASYEAFVHQPWNWFWAKGFFAINAFFVISGFLIGDILIRERESTGRIDFRSFYLRRFFRLAPAYYLVLAGFVAYWFAVDSGQYTLKYLGASFAYLNNWFSQRDQPAQWSWSLAVEEQFYLLCPFLVFFLGYARKKAAWSLSTLIAASIGYAYFVATKFGPFRLVYHPNQGIDDYYAYFDHFYAQTAVRGSALLMGVACAYLARSEKWMRRLASSPATTLLTACFLTVTFACIYPGLNRPSGAILFPVGMAITNNASAFSFACLLILILTKRGFGGWAERFLSAKIWFPFAQVSYGLYLLHYIVLTALYRGISRPEEITFFPLLRNALLALAISFALAVGLNLAVETPFRKLGYRLAKKAGPV
jgi:peptidoglycan/LPS O-acetylase OafA/YrhL